MYTPRQAMQLLKFRKDFQQEALTSQGSPLAWVIYQCCYSLKWIGAGVLVVLTMGMVVWNRMNIIRQQKMMNESLKTK